MDDFRIRQVLLPTDFSEIAENALQTAIAVCMRQKATLTLLHVVEQNYLLVAPEAGGMALDMLPQLEQNADELLNEIITPVIDKHEIAVKSVIRVGNPADEICQLSAEAGIDMIIMGTHGASGLREFFIGSNAYRVVKHAPCPVLTVPGTNRWIDFRKILFPVRMVPGALAKFEIVKPIIRQNGSSLLIAGIVEKNDAKGLVEMKDIVESVKKLMIDDDVICRAEVHNADNIAKHVLRLTEIEKPDLIVITATLEKYSKSLFVGPYTQYIVNHARFPVLSIRPEITADTMMKFGL